MFTIKDTSTPAEQAILEDILAGLDLGDLADLPDSDSAEVATCILSEPYDEDLFVEQSIGTANLHLEDLIDAGAEAFTPKTIELYKIDNATNIAIDVNFNPNPTDFSYGLKIRYKVTFSE